MRKGNFEASIIENMGFDGFGAKEIPLHHVMRQRDQIDAYVELEHGSNYGIRLASSVKGDATIVIDGEQIGTFRVTPLNPVVIERPVNVDKKFTFYKLGSTEADKAGLRSDNEFLGIVQVIFIPENPRKLNILSREPYYQHEKTLTFGGGEATRGGTGLSGKSNQVFGNADEIELDYSNETTITFKLQPKEDDIQPLIDNYKINIRSRKLTRQQFRELFENQFGVNSEQAKSQIIILVSKGVIDPDKLSEYSIDKIRNYYNEGW
jgi:hypothetical protein